MIRADLSRAIKQGLICGLLVAGIVIELQVSAYLAQVSEATTRMFAEGEALSEEVRAATQYAQGVLASVRGTTETVRKSAVEQMGYYEAIGRRSALALARLDILVNHADDRMERMARALEGISAHAQQNMDQVGLLAASAQEDIHGLSVHGTKFLVTSTATMQRVDQRLADEHLDQIVNSLAETSEKAAESTANVAEATGYVRDILSPKRKSFWRRLLELLIPRPTDSVQ